MPRAASAGPYPDSEYEREASPHKPYEFGVKVSVATTLKHSKGGQFVAHVQALPGNPYDGHTLAEVIPEITLPMKSQVNDGASAIST